MLRNCISVCVVGCVALAMCADARGDEPAIVSDGPFKLPLIRKPNPVNPDDSELTIPVEMKHAVKVDTESLKQGLETLAYGIGVCGLGIGGGIGFGAFAKSKAKV